MAYRPTTFSLFCDATRNPGHLSTKRFPARVTPRPPGTPVSRILISGHQVVHTILLDTKPRHFEARVSWPWGVTSTEATSHQRPRSQISGHPATSDRGPKNRVAGLPGRPGPSQSLNLIHFGAVTLPEAWAGPCLRSAEGQRSFWPCCRRETGGNCACGMHGAIGHRGTARQRKRPGSFPAPRRPQGMNLDPARTLVPFWLFIDFNWHCD